MNLLQFLIGFGAGYILASFVESFFHDHVHHARGKFLRLMKRFNLILDPFWQAYRSHTLIHHKETFRKDHVTQFTDSDHKEKVDQLLTDPSGKRIIEEKYGTIINWSSFFMFFGPPLPVIALARFFASDLFFAGFIIPFFIYPLFSMVFHQYLHMPYRIAIAKAPFGVGWFLKTRYMKFIWRHHWVHHRYPRYNFNLLFVGDLIRGVYRKPNKQDLAEMKSLGIPVD